MLRPKVTVLPDAALVPVSGAKPSPKASATPSPKQFTHQVVVEQPLYAVDAADDEAPQGRFAPGTRLLLLDRGDGPLCQVQDEHGVRAMTAYAGLRALR